jgi:APA family basic amino acid/polyamine antiporter
MNRSTWMQQALRRRSLQEIVAQGAKAQAGQRSLSTLDLTLLGVGVVVGTGVFVLTGRAAAMHAGPAVWLSMVLAAVPAVLAGLCYAELAALMPVSGSVYAYTYASLGEVFAFLIGWDLMLEYMLGAATVSVGWSAYLTAFVRHLSGLPLDDRWLQAPVAWDCYSGAFSLTGAYCNLPAAAIVLGVMGVLLRGTQTSARLNNGLVLLKLGIIATFVVVCWGDIRLENLQPMVPPNAGEFGHFGWSGVLRGASLLVFAYLGVDNLSTTALDAHDPQRTLPRAILFTVGICAVLYLLLAVTLCGVVPYTQLGVADPVAVAAAATGRGWLETAVELAAILGLTSVLLVQLYGMPRILCAMATDGLLPAHFSTCRPQTSLPTCATWWVGGACALLGALLPIGMLGELCSSGTLFAFVLVSLAVPLMRWRHPEAPRRFRLPGGPYLVPGACLVVCLGLLVLAGQQTLQRLGVWLLVGLLIYLTYGRTRARLGKSTLKA